MLQPSSDDEPLGTFPIASSKQQQHVSVSRTAAASKSVAFAQQQTPSLKSLKPCASGIKHVFDFAPPQRTPKPAPSAQRLLLIKNDIGMTVPQAATTHAPSLQLDDPVVVVDDIEFLVGGACGRSSTMMTMTTTKLPLPGKTFCCHRKRNTSGACNSCDLIRPSQGSTRHR